MRPSADHPLAHHPATKRIEKKGYLMVTYASRHVVPIVWDGMEKEAASRDLSFVSLSSLSNGVFAVESSWPLDHHHLVFIIPTIHFDSAVCRSFLCLALKVSSAQRDSFGKN